MSENVVEEEKKDSIVPAKKKSKLKIIIVLIAIAIFALYSYVDYRAEYLNMLDLGEEYVDTLEQNYTYLRYIGITNFAVVFIGIFITNIFIKRGLKKFFEQEGKPMPKLANKSIAFIIGLIVAAITSSWMLETTMLSFNATQFGITDPIFNLDIGFYMFQKPFIEMLAYYFIALMIGLAVYSGIYHIIVFNMYFDSIDGKMLRNSVFIKQLLLFAMLIVLGISVLTVLGTQGVVLNEFLTLNNEEETTLVGAGLTEKYIVVWGYRILAIVMIVAAFIAIRAFNKQNSKKVIISLMTIPAYLVLLFVVMMGYEYMYVEQNELDKQKEYIAKNIEFTKTAYNINIEEVEISDSDTLSVEQVEKYQEVIENIPIVSSDIVQTTLEETQDKTGYYTYNETSPTLYNGELVYISAREVTNDSRTYNNKTYQYTHGYGVIITSASKVDETGNLLYLLNDFSDTETVSQPRIYYGMETDNTAVISDDYQEFDYPTTSTQYEETTYDGEGGLELNFLDRLILAVSEGNLKLAFESSDNSILINRDVIERAETAMPYLMYDDEPYLVITDSGELVWVLDAYTTSDQYPYSQTTTIENDGTKQTINYIRNSVKVLINAYDGTIDFYITDRTDPIVMAYNNMYPELFKDASEIPEDISSQFVYSEFLYEIQAEILKLYHNVSTDVLYRGDDVWDVATYSSSTTTTAGEEMEPYYTMLKTVDSDEAQLGLVLPYTIYGKQNMNSYLVGTTNGTESKLTLYNFSQDNTILGPMQLNNLLSEDETISTNISTINVTGTKVIKNMIIVPIDNTLLYVVPIYQTSLNETNSVPILKKVVVASGSKVAIGNDLEEALDNLLSSQNSVEIEVENTDTVDELIEAIIKANNNLNDSSSITDWEQMGKDITKLQNLIDQLEALLEEQETEEVDDGTISELDLTIDDSDAENVVY